MIFKILSRFSHKGTKKKKKDTEKKKIRRKKGKRKIGLLSLLNFLLSFVPLCEEIRLNPSLPLVLRLLYPR